MHDAYLPIMLPFLAAKGHLSHWHLAGCLDSSTTSAVIYVADTNLLQSLLKEPVLSQEMC